MKQWLLERLREGSTWRGLVLLLTVAGLHVSPDQANLIIQVGLGIAGSIGFISPEKIVRSGVSRDTYLSVPVPKGEG